MPTTKSEAMANQFNDLKAFMESFAAGLKEDISGIETKFTEQIEILKVEIINKSEYVEAKISEKIDGINSSLLVEIQDIRTQTQQLGNRIEEVNVAQARSISSIENAINGDINKLKDSTRLISENIVTNREAATAQINSITELFRGQTSRMEAHEIAFNANGLEIQTLKRRLANLEKSSHGGLQHTRGWNVEIDGIPPEVGDDRPNLETAVIALIKGIDVNIEEKDIEACHRLPSRTEEKSTIVRFHTRKIVHEIHDNKNKLKNLATLNVDIAGLDANSRIFIRASQCPYQKNLAYNCRLLKRANLISQTNVGKDGKTIIKTLGNEYIKILHESELKSRFPDFEGKFKFDGDRLDR